MAEGKRYYWLKLKDDFFSSKRIKKLRKNAGGDTYTIIYLKMQLKAIKSNGILEYTGLENDFAEELALDIDEDPDNVRMTINYLISTHLIETSDNLNFFLPYAVENTGTETAAAMRMREMRARRDADELECNNVTPVLRSGYGEKEIESEKEIKKEIEINPESEIEDCQGERADAAPAAPVSLFPEPAQEPMKTTTIDWAGLIKAQLRLGNRGEAVRLFLQAQAEGVTFGPNEFVKEW